MKLADEIARLHAGGPGSGPHAGYQRSAMNISPERIKELMSRLPIPPKVVHAPDSYRYHDEEHGWEAKSKSKSR